jgi:competence protein ComEA
MTLPMRFLMAPVLAGAFLLGATAALGQTAPAAPQGTDTTVPARPVGQAVNINTATTEDLRKLPGITTQRANAIVRARPYSRVDDLVQRRVLKASTFERIKPYIVAN